MKSKYHINNRNLYVITIIMVIHMSKTNHLCQHLYRYHRPNLISPTQINIMQTIHNIYHCHIIFPMMLAKNTMVIIIIVQKNIMQIMRAKTMNVYCQRQTHCKKRLQQYSALFNHWQRFVDIINLNHCALTHNNRIQTPHFRLLVEINTLTTEL